MTITNPNAPRKEYTGNGSLKVYPYDFKVLDSDHLIVYVATVQKTEIVDYTVDGVGTDAGGNVTFIVAPSNGASIILLRQVPLTQETDYQPNTDFPEQVQEDALDKLTMIDQQQDERIQRSISVDPTSLLKNIIVPVGGGKALRWNAGATALELIDLTSVQYASVIVAQGDIIRGSSSGTPERKALGTAGQVLTVVGGQADWADAGTGGVSPTLTNKSGASVAAGDVVVNDPANDNAFTTTTTPNDPRRVMIAQATINNNASGSVQVIGKSTVAVQGVVTRGDYLVCDVNAKFAKSAGATPAGGDPPAGTFALALTSAAGPGAGSVQAALFGYTIPKVTLDLSLSAVILPDGSGSGNAFATPRRRISSGTQGSDNPKVSDAVYDVSVGDHVEYRLALPLKFKVGSTSVLVTWSMVSATSGNVQLKSAGICTDVASADIRARVYNAVTLSGDVAVPGTLGHTKRTTLVLTETGFVALGTLNIHVGRKAASASEASGDLVIEEVVLRVALN